MGVVELLQPGICVSDLSVFLLETKVCIYENFTLKGNHAWII